jgi:hypothetical protein
MQFINLLLGYPESPFYPMSWLEVIDDEYVPLMEKGWMELVQEGKAINLELALKHPWEGVDPTTGEKITGRTYIIAAASPQKIGDATFITGAITDISRQKWVESLQIQRRDEAVELKRQQEKWVLRSSCVAVTNGSSFMDMTSHEMRNPLSAIFQCADAIVTALTDFQTTTRRPRPSTRSQSHRVGKPGDNSNPIADDPVSYAIEAASIITLCAQRKPTETNWT